MYDIKLHLMVKLKIWEVWNIVSLPLLQGPLQPIKVLSIGQIDGFKNYIW